LKAKTIRWAVLGLLLPALAAAPAVAVCADCADTGCSCCCSQSGGCQKAPRQAAQAKCCAAPSAPPPPAAAAPSLQVEPLPERAAEVGETLSGVEQVAALEPAGGAPPVVPSAAALFTLHAAFLI
jgi:hypothetical protein